MAATTEGPSLRLFRAESCPEPQPIPQKLNRLGWFMGAVVFIGIILRIACFLHNQSLWIDEAMLALNLVYRPTAELLRPLDLNQGAPLGYLLLSKLFTQAFGPSEQALRGLSLLAGVTGLLLFIPLAYQILPLFAARLAIVCYSLSPYLVGYCAEFKQYELDATIAVALLLCNWRLMDSPSSGRAWLCAISGALAVWCSHPSLFVLAAVGILALIDARVTRNWPQLRIRFLIVSVWAMSFLLAYTLFLSKLGLNDYLLTYWDGKFLPLPPKSPGDLAWIAHHLLEFFEKPCGFGTAEFALSGLAAFCAACGVIDLLQNRWRLAVVLVGPLLLALLASGLKKYPFAGRLLLFGVPLGICLSQLGRRHFAKS
jgi:hypothetical protein